MRVRHPWLSILFGAFCVVCVSAQSSITLLDRARTAQSAGDYAQAKTALFQAVKQYPDDLAVARAQARMLDAWGDPARREAYQHYLEVLKKQNQQDTSAVRRL